MKRFFTGILKRNTRGTSYLIRTDGDDPVSIRRLNIKTTLKPGMRVIIQGRDNGRMLEVDRIMAWPFPRKKKQIPAAAGIVQIPDAG